MKVSTKKTLCVFYDGKVVLAAKISVVTLRIKRSNGSECSALWLILQKGASPLRLGVKQEGAFGLFWGLLWDWSIYVDITRKLF